MKSWLLLILILALNAASAGATTYWASPSGGAASCAAASGTSDPKFYRTIAQGIACLSGGDTLMLTAGTYLVSSQLQNVPGSVTIQGAPGAIPTISATGNFDMLLQIENSTDVVIKDLILDGNASCDGCGAYYGIYTNNADRLRIENVEIRAAANVGIALYADPVPRTTAIIIINSNIHHNGYYCVNPDPTLYHQGHGMYVTTNGNTVDGSQIHDNAGANVQFYDSPPAPAPSNNTIKNSRWYNSGTNVSTGIFYGQNNVVFNNIFYNNPEGGMRVVASGPNLIYNNTFYGNSGAFGGLTVDTYNGNTVRNNLAIGNSGNGNLTTTGTTGTYDHNNTSETAPNCFTNAAAADFSLKSTCSGAIDQGLNLGSVYATDIVGNARGYNGAWDIGVYEYIGGAPPPVTGELVASFSFDEGSGLPQDSSGKDNHVNIMNSGATWDNNGKYGKAIMFDGTTNASISVPSNSSLNLNPNGMTIEGWVKPSVPITTFKSIVSKTSGQGIYSYWLYAGTLEHICGSAITAAGGFSTTQNNYACDDTNLVSGTWYYLTTTYDGQFIRQYRNGTPINTIASSESIPSGVGSLLIGATVYGENFAGLIDEVRIYSKPLTQAEIQTDMNTPIGGGLPPVAPKGIFLSADTPLKIGAGGSIKIGN